MKNLRLTLLIPLAVLAFAVISYAYTPGGGFAASPHDFSTANPVAGVGDNTQAVGACTFCHTPHRALKTTLLWNHTLSTQTYTWDTTTTIGGTTLPTNIQAWSGPTKLCLSCHDGTVAIGDIAWFNEASHTTAGGGSPINITTHTRGEVLSGETTGLFNIANIGDMSGNHPVAIPYPWYKGAVSTYNGIATGGQLAADLVINSEFAQEPNLNGIRLFNDATGTVSAGPVNGKTGIECSSCHEPHNAPGFVSGDLLLRGSLTGNSGVGLGGYICMKCHTR